MDIEKAEYYKFHREWFNTSPQHLRYGQAFYNHFNLHKMNLQHQFNNLYNAGYLESIRLIHELFNFN